ncbi:MAG: 2-hydroxymuconate tautomerase [Gemmatimonadota bacterium]
MPYVNVRMLKGRTKEQKQKLVKVISDAMAEICGAKPESTFVVVDEVERENWAVGGVLMSDKT